MAFAINIFSPKSCVMMTQLLGIWTCVCSLRGTPQRYKGQYIFEDIKLINTCFKKLDDSLPGGNSFKLTWDVPAMSTPASRKLLNSCPNLLVALARSWVVPLDDWTTSLADWFRPAATSLRWAWTSWKLFPLDGNYVGKKKILILQVAI